MSEVAVERIPLTALSNRGSFLQTRFWAETKRQFGWTPVAFSISADDGKSDSAAQVLALERTVAPGFSFGYVPHGPTLPKQLQRDEVLKAIASGARKLLSRRCIFVRFDLPWTTDDYTNRWPYTGTELVKSAVDVQPPDTVIVDITGTDEEILGRMKSKTRYNTRLADKKGVQTEVCGSEALPRWYAMYRETAERDHILIHSFEYYAAVLKNAAAHGDVSAHVIMATLDGEDLAGIILVVHGTVATYLYGASSNHKRNFMPSYAAQWRGICLARERGCTAYDLFGISPDNDPGHPMAGLYRIKTGYSGNIVHMVGCVDYPYKPLLYRIYRNIEYRRFAKKRHGGG